MQTEQLLFWSGMTDTEQNATSGSNEVVDKIHNIRGGRPNKKVFNQ